LPAKKKESFRELSSSIIVAVLAAVIFRSFLFEPFYIPSGSMKSTLILGDYVFVSKYSYGYSRYSLPFGLPIIPGRIGGHAPERGDVVVFKLPSDTGTNYIKRLIGLPGDEIQMLAGVLYINGHAVPKKRIEDFTDEDREGNQKQIPQYIETLPNGVSYRVLDELEAGPVDTTNVYTVPAGHYFFMGDNRDNSVDSRYLDHVGYVPEINFVGPTNRIFFSSHYPFWQIWKWPTGLRFERFFSPVRYQGE